MRILLWLFLLISMSCSSGRGVQKKNAMVVSARIEASQIGADIMKQGGNAFDAMIATELALAVAYPYAGNIGGGGFMVYRLANGSVGSLDYREVAPLASTKDMFIDENGRMIPGKSTSSAFAVAVPGTIAGIFEVHRKFGSLPITQLFAPAIALCEQGVVVTHKQLAQQLRHQKELNAINGSASLYSKNYQAGDTIRNPALANTLKRIAANGETEFYDGETASTLIRYLNSKAGNMTREDLKLYTAKWRTPIVFAYKDLKVISMGPPSSGGICLAQIMKMIEPYDVSRYGHNSAAYMQVLIEAERRSYADRNHFLGDPDFTNIPTAGLLDENYLKERMANFSWVAATKSADIDHGKVSNAESDETTHYSITDSFGNAVAATTTLNGAFGSKLYIDELGFFLNNQMDDFSARPGIPNSYGLVGAEANSIAPRKRMLSSMTPTIVEKNGKLSMVLGTPGGSTIITSVLQTILNVYEFNMTMQQAVNAPRFHHQWLPDEVNVEPARFDAETLRELQQKQYNINDASLPIIGKVDAILIQPKGMEAGADMRGDDAAAGF